jgi:ubiquinone/menaquinone biosynthesis C-methylase UbiE
VANTDWVEVWQRKSGGDTDDPYWLSGFENTTFDPASGSAKLAEILRITPDDAVLEVGCAAGVVARHLKCKYVGCDREPGMVRRMIELGHFSAVVSEADRLIFGDKTFDKVFAFGVFHYFPDYAYTQKAISEMIRVARNAVFVGDLPRKSHDESHLLYEESMFKGWQISEGLYTPHRFNAVLFL